MSLQQRSNFLRNPAEPESPDPLGSEGGGGHDRRMAGDRELAAKRIGGEDGQGFDRPQPPGRLAINQEKDGEIDIMVRVTFN